MKFHMVPVFNRDQEYGKMPKILEKYISDRLYSNTTWSIYNQSLVVHHILIRRVCVKDNILG